MIPGKINTHLFQDLTVLAKANQKGSIVYISPDKKIHSGTVFQKLKALVFKTTSSENKRSDSNLSAKNLVIENLEKQISSIPSIKLVKNYKNYGNLVSSSIPNLLFENIDELKNSRFQIFSGFGVGLKHTSLVFQNPCV